MKEEFKDLTVVTPLLNGGVLFRETAERVRRLRDRNVTWIVVDSDSSDGSKEIAKKYADEVMTVPRGNMYRAINAGCEAARSHWITYLNADDLLFEDGVESALAGVGQHDVAYGNIDYIDYEGRLVYNWRSAPVSRLGGTFRCGVMPMSQPGTVFSKDVWSRLSGFDESYKYSADFDFFYRAFLLGCKFKKIDTPRIAAFRLHGEQFSQLHSKFMREEVERSRSQGRLPSTSDHLNCMFWKWLNLDSYAIRFLRTFALTGKFGCRRSTDLT